MSFSRIVLSAALAALAGCGGKSTLSESPCAAGLETCASASADAGSWLAVDASGDAVDSSVAPADPDASAAAADAGPVVVASIAPCLAAHQNTIYLNGDPDDPVHPGEATYTFPVTVAGCGGYMSTPADLGTGCPASFGSDTAEIGFYFRSADGRPLKLGVYENALSTDRLPGYPFMSVRAQGAYGGACSDYSIGRFQIEQLDLDSRGQAREVLISFEQRCTLTQGGLRGCMRYTQGTQ